MSAPLGYFAREAAKSLLRAGSMSLVAISALTLAALAAGAFGLAWRNGGAWNQRLGTRLEVVAFLKPGLAPIAVEAAAGALRSLSGVASAELVSPEQAATELRKDEDLRQVFDALGENPLPHSLRLRLKEPSSAALSDVGARAAKVEGVEAVDDGQDASKELLRALGVARAVLFGLGALLGLSALLIVASVTRLTAHARREELQLMRLVGASPWFIRTPLVLEGALQGLIGGALAATLLATSWGFLSARLRHDLQIELTAFLPYGPGLLYGLWLSVGAMGLGALGSLLAVLRAPRPERG